MVLKRPMGGSKKTPFKAHIGNNLYSKRPHEPPGGFTLVGGEIMVVAITYL